LNTHGIAKFLLSKAVRQAQFKAVLTGEGADEVFGGYVHYRKDMLLQRGTADSERHLNRLMDQNMISQHLMKVGDHSASLYRLKTILGSVPTFMGAFSLWCDQLLGLLKDSFRAAFRHVDAWQVLLHQFDLPGQLNGRLPINQSFYLWSRTMLPNYVLTVLGDRMEMSHSIAERLPRRASRLATIQRTR
jgi:asparagine synthase (glutamine-hydrolysing)